MMEQEFGTRTTQTEGLQIYSTIDADAQREAVRAIRRGMHGYEARHGRPWRGELVNIAVGQGHPAEIMDMTFGLQSLAPKYLLENRASLEPRFYTVPESLDEQVARMKLDTMGIQIDARSEEQRQYDDYY